MAQFNKVQMPTSSIKRYIRYIFWVGLEAVLITGLPRLVIFPAVAYFLGQEEFGLFIFLLGFVMMIGKAPSVGLETGIIRFFSELDDSARRILSHTCIQLCKIAMLVIVGIGGVGLVVARYLYEVELKIIWCLIPLLLFLYTWNLFELQMVKYRIERRFGYRTGWYSILSLLLLIAIPAAIFGGIIGMAWGYTFGYVTVYVLLSWKQKTLRRNLPYDAELAKKIKNLWWHVSLASVLALSSRYIYRLILGLSSSYSDVSIFFGATNILDLCLAPVGILSSLLLSMLSGFSRLEDIGKRKKYIVGIAAISISAGAILFVFVAGTWVLSVMFPQFASESARILRFLVFVIPCSVIILFSRPFVTKFGPIKFIPILNLVTLLAHCLPAILYIPKRGVEGAAIAYNIGYGLSAASWLIALIWVFVTNRHSDSNVSKLVEP